MDLTLRNRLIEIVKGYMPSDDPSHDINHVLRVLANAEELSKGLDLDLDIVVTAALFHDLITYPKNDPRNKNAVDESADQTGQILILIADFPQQKITEVTKVIRQISFSRGVSPSCIEAAVVQDADMLESVGAISIMRLFASSGKMNRSFYNPDDPFAERRELNISEYAVDLFYARLLVVQERLNTDRAKEIARQRTEFLVTFLEQLRSEIP